MQRPFKAYDGGDPNIFISYAHDPGHDWLEQSGMTGWATRLNATRILSPSAACEVENHPRFKVMLDRLGIGDDYRRQVLERINDLTDVTGIHVQPDGDY